eukprot:3375430-Alexandrium_andersonii.AAC.1
MAACGWCEPPPLPCQRRQGSGGGSHHPQAAIGQQGRRRAGQGHVGHALGLLRPDGPHGQLSLAVAAAGTGAACA